MTTRKSQQRQSYGGTLLALESDPRLVAMPTGGTINQVLAKKTATAYDTQWVDPPSGGSGGGLTPTASQTANYTATSGQLVLCNAVGGGFTVTLPASPAAGATVGVKKTDSSGNSVVVVGSGGTTIDGDANCAIVAPDAAATFVFDGTNWQIQNTAIVSSGSDSVQQIYTTTYTVGNWYDRRSAFPFAVSAPTITPGTAGTAAIASSSVAYVPVFLHRAVTIDTAGIFTGATAPTNGAQVQLGLYTNTATNVPGTRTALFGTAAPTAATTAYTVSTSATIPKGWSWFGLAFNATSVGSIYAASVSSLPHPAYGSTTLSALFVAQVVSPAWYWESGTTLPATATPLAQTASVGSTANLFFRVSA